MIYFENFSFVSFTLSFWKISKTKNISAIYFIDGSYFSKKILVPILRFFGTKIFQLDFKLIEIIDDKGELVSTRIARYDLFEFKDKILKSNAYKSLFHESWLQDNIIEYVIKGLTYSSSMDSNSANRMLFIINVVNWHAKKIDIKKSIFITDKRPWFNFYQEYSKKFNITIFETRSTFFNFIDLKSFIRKNPFFYKFFKNYKYRSKLNANQKVNLFESNNKLYLEGRGDINLSNDGMHSDFFWQKNSDFELKNILYKHHSDKERDYFLNNGLHSISEGIYSNAKDLRKYIAPTLNYSKEFKKEYKVIKNMLSTYDLDRFYWASLFRRFGVKVFFTWYKYSNDHIALSDAIKDIEGVSVNWQMAFDGFKNMDCVINSDIVFSYSQFSDEIEKNIESKIKYNVIVGYPKDYAPALLKDKAAQIRAKLRENGAKKIVFVIDENSVDDSRWHSGHELQRENYSYILEKVIDTPWLGVVFKPKRAKNLRQRLGPISKLLNEAIATGRCFIFEQSSRHTTDAPPILAGLVSDVCIHSHLNAGTAALECALEGLPTLLIDREKTVYSKFYDLPNGKVIFQDWPSTIDACMKYFKNPEKIPGFGDWTSIIDELDPFRDGMAAYRMGTYLKWLIDGYDNGLERDEIMENAAERYKKQWGEDKVITA
jgi:hypothetical protein